MQTTADELKRKRMANLRPRPRVKGQANRITRDLRQAIIAAAEAYGSDGYGSGGVVGYCYFLAARHPRAFTGLLGKMLPLQVSGSVQSVVEQVTIVSVPAGNFLSKDVPPTDS
ncbi:hypothetical protein KIP88_14825 [Bradyrhizobium sp. SRL28]|uniref:hypothetical protein n=1 Tax=Bradyrhizobium sp. SRL28 TaxID=2836178 RepID=UPI001BDDCC3C|nr:hypothetical protein [Bradyrhizobium sp. SRL28]MBT1511783.1 hypothetical protein [Bradyrhizobium sp. SRL28]